jgi:hypothetical protein
MPDEEGISYRIDPPARGGYTNVSGKRRKGPRRSGARLATGGGAGLPIVQELGEKGILYGGKQVKFKLIGAMADDIRESYPDLIDPYPQIAVALGGSLPHLPEQKASIGMGITTPPKLTLAPMYKS